MKFTSSQLFIFIIGVPKWPSKQTWRDVGKNPSYPLDFGILQGLGLGRCRLITWAHHDFLQQARPRGLEVEKR